MISQIFSRNQILTVTWKAPGQHSAMENAVFCYAQVLAYYTQSVSCDLMNISQMN